MTAWPLGRRSRAATAARHRVSRAPACRSARRSTDTVALPASDHAACHLPPSCAALAHPADQLPHGTLHLHRGSSQMSRTWLASRGPAQRFSPSPRRSQHWRSAHRVASTSTSMIGIRWSSESSSSARARPAGLPVGHRVPRGRGSRGPSRAAAPSVWLGGGAPGRGTRSQMRCNQVDLRFGGRSGRPERGDKCLLQGVRGFSGSRSVRSATAHPISVRRTIRKTRADRCGMRRIGRRLSWQRRSRR